LLNWEIEGRCQKCDQSVRPGPDEPIRPPDPLDLIAPPPEEETEHGAGAEAVDERT
jgi:hypothetical protein